MQSHRQIATTFFLPGCYFFGGFATKRFLRLACTEASHLSLSALLLKRHDFTSFFWMMCESGSFLLATAFCSFTQNRMPGNTFGLLDSLQCKLMNVIACSTFSKSSSSGSAGTSLDESAVGGSAGGAACWANGTCEEVAGALELEVPDEAFFFLSSDSKSSNWFIKPLDTSSVAASSSSGWLRFSALRHPLRWPVRRSSALAESYSAFCSPQPAQNLSPREIQDPQECFFLSGSILETMLRANEAGAPSSCGASRTETKISAARSWKILSESNLSPLLQPVWAHDALTTWGSWAASTISEAARSAT